MSKVTVHVTKAFLLTREDHTRVQYPVGTHSMPKDDAEHWYTRHHIATPEEPKELPPLFVPGGTGENPDQNKTGGENPKQENPPEDNKGGKDKK